MQQNKLIEFGTYLQAQLELSYTLEGHVRAQDKGQVFKQASDTAQELISQFPHLTLSNLEICVPMARKTEGKLNYTTIVKTLKSTQYQQALMEVNRKNKPSEMIEHQKGDIPTPLWKSIWVKVWNAYVPKLKDFPEPDRILAKKMWGEEIKKMDSQLVAQADKIEAEALSLGYSENDTYKGEV